MIGSIGAVDVEQLDNKHSVNDKSSGFQAAFMTNSLCVKRPAVQPPPQSDGWSGLSEGTSRPPRAPVGWDGLCAFEVVGAGPAPHGA